MKKTKPKKINFFNIILFIALIGVVVFLTFFKEKAEIVIQKREYVITGNDSKGIKPQDNNGKSFQPGATDAVFPEKLTW